MSRALPCVVNFRYCFSDCNFLDTSLLGRVWFLHCCRTVSASAALLQQIKHLEAETERKRSAQVDQAARLASYGVNHCSKCHHVKKKGHDVEACEPCPNWIVDDDGETVDACGQPTE